jgi:hypothetical protein
MQAAGVRALYRESVSIHEHDGFLADGESTILRLAQPPPICYATSRNQGDEGMAMSFEETGLACVDEDPVLHLLITGEAQTLHEAEELYLNRSMPEILQLFESPLSDEELANHPLLVLLRAHGSRGWEESLL